jgi:hypothetical protein
MQRVQTTASIAFCRALVAMVLGAATAALPVAAADRSGKCPGWLAPGDVSPFFPDDAFTLHTPGHKRAFLRAGFELAQAPRRAVLAVRGWHTLAVLLNGVLVAEAAGNGPESDPVFAEVTPHLRTGANRLDLRAWSEWTPTAYVQVRIELPEGNFQDVVSDASWEWCPAAPEGWPRGPAPEAGWQPAPVLDDYYGSRGAATRWGKEFALLPRDLLQERMGAYNGRLEAAWPHDRAQRKPSFAGNYTLPEYAAQYRGPLRLDPDSGQLLDAGGTVRHLFFTIYQQFLDGHSVLNWQDIDFGRLEEDLGLMEAGAVHPYLRFLGWQHLLDSEGNWRPCEKQPRGSNLPRFAYVYEVLDYFLDRCQAHGRFVAIECDFFWAADWDALPAPYHTRYYLYPEVTAANALAQRKILARYADCASVAGFMIGEEDIIMAPDLENGHLRTAFQGYLRERYGTLENVAAAWQRGYDWGERSAWRSVRRRPHAWGLPAENGGDEEVLLPRYPLSTTAWSGLEDWSRLGLPVWPRLRWPVAPHAELVSHMAFPGDPVDTDDDPVWIDYNAFREDRLYLDFVSHWAERVREAVPRHWLFHSNAQDYTAQWHFLHFQRRAELPFSVIGVGSHDSGMNLAEIPAWDRIRKYTSIISAYRPYALAPGSPALAIASGEGEGGRAGDEAAILDYYRGQSLEMVGHGAAFELSYTWGHLSGANQSADGRGHLTKALEWMGSFYRAVDGIAFPLQRQVPALIVRNNALQRSNRSGRDYGNALGLLGFLAQLNLDVDTVMDLDLAYGSHERKVDLANYRMVFLPCLECDFTEATWQALNAWLSDPEHRGRRTLVVGSVGQRTPYLAPTPAFHPVLARWLGTDRYADTVLLRGRQALTWRPRQHPGQARPITLDFGDRGDITPLGLFGVGEPLLTLGDGRVLGISALCAGNAVHAFGFPLGLAFDNLWGLPYGQANGRPAPQEPYDVLARLYGDLRDAAGITGIVDAPHNVRVAVSPGLEIILLREWFGLPTTELCTLALPVGAVYAGCEAIPQPDGRTLLRANLPAYGGICLTRVKR